MNTTSPSSFFEYSGQDPMLRHLTEVALETSPWLLPREDGIAIDWVRALEAMGPKVWSPSLPDLPKVLSDAIPEIPIDANIYGSPGERRSDLADQSREAAHIFETRQYPLPQDLVRWFDRFRDLADRILFYWDEAYHEDPALRAEFRVQGDIEDLRIARSKVEATHAVQGLGMTYPIRARIYLGAQLLPENLAVHSSYHGTDSLTSHRHLALVSAQMSALRQVWSILWPILGEAEASSAKDLRSRLQGGLKSPAMRRLYQTNRDLTSMRILPKAYRSYFNVSLQGKSGLARIERFVQLLDAQGRPCHNFSQHPESGRNELPHAMQRTLSDCFLRLSVSTRYKLPTVEKLRSEIRNLERDSYDFVHRPVITDPDQAYRARLKEPKSWSVEDLNVINDTVDDLIAHSPFLLLLSSGVLSAYLPIDDESKRGWALHPFALALGLSPHIEAGAWPGRFFSQGMAGAAVGDPESAPGDERGPGREQDQETVPDSTVESPAQPPGLSDTTQGRAVWRLFDRC